jgi:hypothetical protein
MALNSLSFLKNMKEWDTFQGRLFIKDVRGFRDAMEGLIRDNYEDIDFIDPSDIEDPIQYIIQTAFQLPLPSVLDEETLELIPSNDDLADMVNWDDPLDAFMEHFQTYIDWSKSGIIVHYMDSGLDWYQGIKPPREIPLIQEGSDTLEVLKRLTEWMPEEEAPKHLTSEIGILKLAAELRLDK